MQNQVFAILEFIREFEFVTAECINRLEFPRAIGYDIREREVAIVEVWSCYCKEDKILLCQTSFMRYSFQDLQLLS